MSTASNDNDEIRRLFREHIPEVANGVVEMKSIARDPGQRTIVAVHSSDPSICPVGSCVGLRGDRVKTIIKQLPGDKVDIVRWSESIEEFIRNALAPARAERIVFDAAGHSATIHASPEYRSLILGRQGTRLGLLSRLVGWDIRVMDP
jgi:N utilization substance protein A